MMAMPANGSDPMTIQLKDETAALLAEHLRDGAYADFDELVTAALNALVPPVADEELLGRLDEAEEDVRQGRVLPWNQVRDDISERFLEG
jgi:Arc/MetJ-type ribon-helix-helix transcriptional regulator